MDHDFRLWRAHFVYDALGSTGFKVKDCTKATLEYCEEVQGKTGRQLRQFFIDFIDERDEEYADRSFQRHLACHSELLSHHGRHNMTVRIRVAAPYIVPPCWASWRNPPMTSLCFYEYLALYDSLATRISSRRKPGNPGGAMVNPGGHLMLYIQLDQAKLGSSRSYAGSQCWFP